MHIKIYVAAGLLAVGLMAAVAPTPASAISLPTSEKTSANDDLAAVSQLTGLAGADASSFADLQSAVESIGSQLSANSAVTAFWIEPDGGGSLVIGLRDLRDSSAVLARLPEALRPKAKFIQQQYSESELGAAASAVAGTYAKAGTPAYGSVDVRAQQASVTLDKNAAARSQPLSSSAVSITVGNGVVPVTVSVGDVPTPAASIYAGLVGTACTTGFTVVHTSGSRGVTTAAHCGNSQTVSGVALTFKFEWQYGSADVQWHSATGQTFRNWAYDGLNDQTTPYYRVISGKIPRLSLVIGGTYCKYGKTTGYGCGTLASRVETPSWVNNASPTFLAIDNPSQVISLGGDSGGPTFSGGSAVGLVSGTSNSGHRLVSMSMDGFAGLGITVATS